MQKYFIGLALIVAFVALGVGFNAADLARNAGQGLGASAGTVHSFLEEFVGGLRTFSLVQTGLTTTLTVGSSTQTLTAAQLCSGNEVIWANTTQNATATLPTAQNLLQCLPKVGNKVRVYLRSTAATTTWNIATSTGETFYRSVTSTAGQAITSSTPAFIDVDLTLASGSDSTANVLLTRFINP